MNNKGLRDWIKNIQYFGQKKTFLCEIKRSRALLLEGVYVHLLVSIYSAICFTDRLCKFVKRLLLDDNPIYWKYNWNILYKLFFILKTALRFIVYSNFHVK